MPCPQFRQGYRINRVLCSPHKDLSMTPESRKILHQVYTALLNHLKAAKTYVDVPTHGTTKLTAYFSILNYCTISKTEKLLVSCAPLSLNSSAIFELGFSQNRSVFSSDSIWLTCGTFSTPNYQNLEYQWIRISKRCWFFGIKYWSIAPKTCNKCCRIIVSWRICLLIIYCKWSTVLCKWEWDATP